MEWGAEIFLAQHLNAADRHAANYPLALITDEAPPETVTFAQKYVQLVDKHVPWGGLGRNEPGRVNVVKIRQRGHYQISKLEGRGVLLEPMFVSNPSQAEWLLSGGHRMLAEIIVACLQETFPHGCKAGMSIGHLYKVGQKANDQGSRLVLPAGSDSNLLPQVMWEGYWCEQVLRQVLTFLPIVRAEDQTGELILSSDETEPVFGRSEAPEETRPPEQGGDDLAAKLYGPG